MLLTILGLLGLAVPQTIEVPVAGRQVSISQLTGVQEAAARQDPGDVPRIVNDPDSAFKLRVYSGTKCNKKKTEVAPGNVKRGGSYKARNSGFEYRGGKERKIKGGKCYRALGNLTVWTRRQV